MKGVLVILLHPLLEPKNMHHQSVLNVVYGAILGLDVLIVIKLGLIKNIKDCVAANSLKIN